MTSLVTTLTLMMAFNAIVFDGVSAQFPSNEDYLKELMKKKLDECLTIMAKDVPDCVGPKWTQSVDTDQKSRECCAMAEIFCAAKRVAGSDECKRMIFNLTNWERSSLKMCSGVTDNSQKYCSTFKTNPIEGKCKDVEKYMNCFSASSHLMSRPLLVFTPIVTLFVIYFFN